MLYFFYICYIYNSEKPIDVYVILFDFCQSVSIFAICLILSALAIFMLKEFTFGYARMDFSVHPCANNNIVDIICMFINSILLWYM